MTTTQDRPSSVEVEPPAVRGDVRLNPLPVDPGQRANPTEADAGAARGRPDDKQAQPRAGRSWIARHTLLTALILVVALAAIGAGVLWWLKARHYEDTDDAFIDARPSAISAQVAAAITDVPVTDNEIFEPGQVLTRLDNRDYRAAQAQAQAQAQTAQAEASISSAEAQSAAQQASINEASLQVTQAQAALAYSKDQNGRAQSLLTRGSCNRISATPPPWPASR